MVVSKPKIIQLGNVELAVDVYEDFKQHVEIVKAKAQTRADFLEECRSGALDGCVAMYRTYSSIERTGPFDKELIQVLPDSLKFICSNGAGYDIIDIESCTSRRIQVANTPTVNHESTANVAMFLILGCLHNLHLGVHNLRAGEWRGSGASLAPFGREGYGKILGILGMGGVGRNVANKARVFGLKIRYHNRNRLAQENEEGAEYVDFEKLLRESDVLYLSLPLNADTHHIISSKELAMMKKGSSIINTARGSVLDEAALVEALKSGHLAGAGLDVYANEPEVHPELIKMDNALLTPHMGGWCHEGLVKMEACSLDNARLAATKGYVKTIVPEQRDLEKQMLKEAE